MNVDKENSLRNSEIIKQELEINFIVKLRKYFPNGKFHTLILIFFKFLGVLIITHSGIAQNQNSLTPITSTYVNIASYLRKFLFFQLNETNLKKFSLYCLIIYFIVSFTIFLFYIVYNDYRERFYAKKSGNKIISSKKFKNSLHENSLNSMKLLSVTFLKKVLKCFTCFMINLIVLFSQHLIEILANVYLDLYITEIYKNDLSNQNDKNYRFVIENQQLIESNLLINRYFFCVLNIIFIVIINVISYLYFKYLNEPFISSKTCMKYSTNKSFILALVLQSNFTAVHMLDIVFHSANSINIKITQLILIFILLTYHLSSYNKFVYFNLINFLCLLIKIFCLISIIIEFIIYLSKNSEITFDIKVNFLRFLIEGILSIILTIIFFLRKKMKNLKKIPQIIFSKNKFLSSNSLRELLLMLKKGIYHSKNLNEIFLIFNEHRNSCINTDKSCSCEKYEIDNFLSRFLERKNVVVTHDNHFIRSFEESFSEIIILLETEILKGIFNISNKKTETDEKIENFLLIHIEYILYFKRKTQFSIYLKNRYQKLFTSHSQSSSNSSSKDFMVKFYLKILEKKSLAIEKDTILGKSESFNRETKFSSIFSYINLLNTIQSLMVKNLENFEKLIKLKNLYNSRLVKGGLAINKEIKQKINTQNLIQGCLKLNHDYQDLISLLNREFIDSNLQNAEICFLLHNFYHLINKEIPDELDTSFLTIADYEILRQFQTSFEEMGIRHPMILNLTLKNFTISYISQKLCDILGFKREELIKEDFHKLLPDIIKDEHTLVIRKFLLIEKNNFFKKETFIIAKNGRFLPVNVTFSVLPGLSQNTYLVDFKTNTSLSVQGGNLNYQNGISNYNYSSNGNSYVIVLDRSFSLITFNQEFEDNFSLCLEMMKKTEASILALFGISENHITNEFRENLKDVINLKSNIDHFDNLVEIMRCPELKLMLRDDKKRKKDKYDEIQNQSHGHNPIKNAVYHDFSRNFDKNTEIKFGDNCRKSKLLYRRKKVLLPYLQKLQSVIIENEYPREWLVSVSDLEKSLFQVYTPSTNSYVRKGEIPNSNLNRINSNNPNDLLKIEVQLRNLVNLPYYLIRMWDSRAERTDRMIKAQTSFKNLMNSSIGKSKGRPNLESSQILEPENKEIGVNYIKNKKGIKFTYKKDFTLRPSKFEEIDENIEENEELYDDYSSNPNKIDFLQFANKEDLKETKVISNSDREEVMKLGSEERYNKKDFNISVNKSMIIQKNICVDESFSHEEKNSKMNSKPKFKTSKTEVNKEVSENLKKNLILEEEEEKKGKNNSKIEKNSKREKTSKNRKKNKKSTRDSSNTNTNPKSSLFAPDPPISKNSHFNLNSNSDSIPNSNNQLTSDTNSPFNNTGANLINVSVSLNNSLGLGLNLNQNSKKDRHRSLFNVPNNKIFTTNRVITEFTDNSSIYNFKDSFNNNKFNSARKFRNKLIQHKKSSKKLNKTVINFILLFISLLILSFVSIYNVFFSLNKLESSLKLFQLNFSILGLKSSIVYLSSTVVSACLKTGENKNSENLNSDFSSVDNYKSSMTDFQTELKRRSKEMYFYVYRMKILLGTQGDINGIKNIDDIMNRSEKYSLLAENWEVFTRQNTFTDELDYFHYYVANLENSGLWGTCEISGSKYGNKLLVPQKDLSSLLLPAQFGEKTTFYTIQNVMKKFRINLDDLITASSKLLQDFHEDSKKDLLIFNITIFLVFLTLGLTIIISIVQYKNKINSVLKKLFEVNKEDDIFEKRLMNFKTVLLCLDRNVAEQYEENKLSISLEIKEFKLKMQEMKNKNYFNTRIDTENGNGRNLNNKEKTKNSKNSSSYSYNLSLANESQGNNKSGVVSTLSSVSTHNMSSSLHQTNSHLLFSVDNSRDDNHTLKILNPVLGKKKNTVLKKNVTGSGNNKINISSANLAIIDANNSYNPSEPSGISNNLVPYKSQKETMLERSIIDYINLKDKETNLLNYNYKENFEDYFFISFVKSSFVIIFVFNLFYIMLILVNIVTNMDDFDGILFSNRIAMNFMDRVPRLMDLISYYKISILLNDVDFITKNQNEYNSLSEFYNVLNTEVNLKDDTLFSSLPQSEFSFLLFMLQVERNNIKSFMDDKYSNILPNTRALEKLFNSKEACVTLGMKSLNYAPSRDDVTYVDFRYWFKLANNFAVECKNTNLGMNLKGFDLAIDSHLSSLLTLYLDYNKLKNKNTVSIPSSSSNLNSTSLLSHFYFLTDFNFLRAQNNAFFTLKRFHNSILYVLEPDMIEGYNQIRKKEYVFSFMKTIFALSFIIYFIFMVLLKLQKYSDILKLGVKKFVKAVS